MPLGPIGFFWNQIKTSCEIIECYQVRVCVCVSVYWSIVWIVTVIWNRFSMANNPDNTLTLSLSHKLRHTHLRQIFNKSIWKWIFSIVWFRTERLRCWKRKAKTKQKLRNIIHLFSVCSNGNFKQTKKKRKKLFGLENQTHHTLARNKTKKFLLFFPKRNKKKDAFKWFLVSSVSVLSIR